MTNKHKKIISTVQEEHHYIIQLLILNQTINDFQCWTESNIKNSHFDDVNQRLQNIILDSTLTYPFNIRQDKCWSYKDKHIYRLILQIPCDDKKLQFAQYDLSYSLVFCRKEWHDIRMNHAGVGWDFADGVTCSVDFLRDATRICYGIIDKSRVTFPIPADGIYTGILNLLIATFNTAVSLYIEDCRLAELRRNERLQSIFTLELLDDYYAVPPPPPPLPLKKTHTTNTDLSYETSEITNMFNDIDIEEAS